MSQLQPLHDRVVIRRLEEENKTKGGILLAGTPEKPSSGEVIAVGPGKTCKDGKVCSLAVKVGDKVLFGKYSGTEVDMDGEKLVVMREEDIFAIIK